MMHKRFSLEIRVRSLELLLLMIIFSLGASLFLFGIGSDALNGENSFQFFADSNTYHKAYDGAVEGLNGNLLSVSNNYLGPIAILQLVGGNIYLVMLLNVYLFSHSIIHIASLLRLNPLAILILLLLSPLTVSSLLSVNKEVLIFPFLAFAFHGYIRRSVIAIVIALIFSLMVRWQLTVVYLLLLLISGPIHLFKSRKLLLFAMLLCASISYRLMQEWLAPVIENAELSFANYEGGGSGIFELMTNLQKDGFYILVFPFKALHLLFSLGLKIDNVFNPTSLYNDLFVGGHCLVAFFTFCALVARRKFTISSDLMFASLIYLAVFCLSPIFAPRYLYGVFVLWVLIIAGAPNHIPRRGKKFLLQTA